MLAKKRGPWPKILAEVEKNEKPEIKKDKGRVKKKDERKNVLVEILNCLPNPPQ